MPYDDFKSYIQDKCQNLIVTAIQKYIDDNADDNITQTVDSIEVNGLVGQSEISFVCKFENDIVPVISDGRVVDEYGNIFSLDEAIHNPNRGYVAFYDKYGDLYSTENIIEIYDNDDLVSIEVRVYADITENSCNLGKGKSKHLRRSFFVYMYALLDNESDIFEVNRVEENTNGEFAPTSIFEEFFLPICNYGIMEYLAESEYAILAENYKLHLTPLQNNFNEEGLTILESDLPDNVFAHIYFKEDKLECYDPYDLLLRKKREYEITRGTVIINSDHKFMDDYGGLDFIIAHELAHWKIHRNFFRVLTLLNEEAKRLSCDIIPRKLDDNSSGVRKALWWAEWQADNMASRIVMPQKMFFEEYDKQYGIALAECPVVFSGEYVEIALERMAVIFNVSKYAVKDRAIQLGIMEADGTMLSFDNNDYPPIYFERTSLSTTQTYAIDDETYIDLLKTDLAFAEMISLGVYVRVECFVVLKDPLYVIPTFYPHIGYELTQFARDHADKCCMKFDKYCEDNEFDVDFRGQCYLSKQMTADFCYRFRPSNDLENQDSETVFRISKRYFSDTQKLVNIKNTLPSSFSETLCKHMKMGLFNDNKRITVKVLRSRIGLSEKSIGRLRNDYTFIPSRETVCALCIGLHLPPMFSEDMLMKAGYIFRDTPEDIFQKSLLSEFYSESLVVINKILMESGIAPWTNNNKIQEK